MASWLSALTRTRDRIVGALTKVFTGREKLDAASREELEALLVQADIPLALAHEALEACERVKAQPGGPRAALRQTLISALGTGDSFAWKRADRPAVLLVVGINGSGKTTTCAKLALMIQRAGLKPLLAAGDTYRAAGADQLRIWADRVKCEVVGGQTGGDAAAVAFDAVAAGQARGVDWVVLDTAGRMHTRQPLMQELEKVRRAMAKKLPAAPHETWIVLDASMGQNALNQARQFHQSVPLTGVVITKLDGSAKAGFLFAVRKELGLPIRFVGLGETADDLAAFEPAAFVDALLGLENPYKD